MRPTIAVVVIVAALIIAAGLVAHAGIYQIVATGPDTAYKVHRLTGEVWRLTGATAERVKTVPFGIEKDYGK